MPNPKLKVVDGMAAKDPFSFEDRGYDVEKIYTKSTGPNGEPGETKYMKFSPLMLGAINVVVYSKHLPAYKTDADFIRDAVVHRLHFINSKIANGDVEAGINYQIKMDQIEALRLDMTSAINMIEMFDNTMREAYEANDPEVLGMLLDQAEGAVNEIRQVYQNRLQVIIDKYRENLKRL